MKLIWKIEKEDINKIKKFYLENKNNDFVRKRISRNINKKYGVISEDNFFKEMVSCLLTTQQRSGPNSPVTKLINTKPFPLKYRILQKHIDKKNIVLDILNSHKGIRRKNKITDEIITNILVLENNLWEKIAEIVKKLEANSSIAEERLAADFLMDKFKGFGPKQSRNLLQSLGLTRFEIPIDSRITKWLNKFGFPVKLSADSLADINYYNFVSDGFQKLCKESGIDPCVLDAVIFSSYDNY